MVIFGGPHRRRLSASLCTGMLLSLLVPAMPAAAAGDAVLFLRPHCEEEDQQACALFDVIDPTTLRTGTLAVGDTLDMDLMLLNPSSVPVARVRAWLSYDPNVLAGNAISVTPLLPAVTPGEADFSETQGYAKISAATDGGQPLTDFLLPVARIRFVVKAAPAGGQSPISLYDVKEDSTGHTFVSSDTTPNILQPTQGSLVVQTAGGSATSSTVSVTASSAIASISSQSSAASVSSGSPAQGVSFNLIQVQNVRTGTDGTSLYVTWDPLRSSQLRGYNVYYGTSAGTYAQRRVLSQQVTSTIIAGLAAGSRYYVAIRAVNDKGEESAFSRESAIEIGNPLTSTNPLPVGGGRNGNLTAPANPVGGSTSVPGAAGAPTFLVVFLLLSASIGTLIAFRRQLIATAPRS